MTALYWMSQYLQYCICSTHFSGLARPIRAHEIRLCRDLHSSSWAIFHVLTSVSHQAHSGYHQPWRFAVWSSHVPPRLQTLRDFETNFDISSEPSRFIGASAPMEWLSTLLSHLPGLQFFRLTGLAIPRLFEADVRIWSSSWTPVIQPFFHGVSLFRTYYISL